MSHPMSSSNNEELVRWEGEEKDDESTAHFSYITSEQQGTIEGRENQRELISNARPQDPEQVLDEQRILAEGLDIAGAVIENRQTTDEVDIDFSEQNVKPIERTIRKERNDG